MATITTLKTTLTSLVSVTTTTAGTLTDQENPGVLPTTRILGLKDGTSVRLIVAKKVKEPSWQGAVGLGGVVVWVTLKQLIFHQMTAGTWPAEDRTTGEP